MINLQGTVTRFNSGRHIVFLLNVLLRMRSSEKLSAAVSRDKLFTWIKVVPPTRVTLFRKQGNPTPG